MKVSASGNNKFVFEIILNDQMVIDLRMTDQLQASFYRHDLAPFRHVRRRNIDHIAAFVPVMDIKAVILKDGAACGEGRCGERNGFPFMD